MTTAPVPKLLPCAFCGAEGATTMRNFSSVGRMDHHYLFCHGCGACGPSGRTEDQARAAWAMRPAASAPKAAYIEWIPMSEQWPPIDVDVLVACAGKGYTDIHTNQLCKGSDIGPRYDPELYYWQGGEDFEEVTHWAPLPAMPALAGKCDGGELEVVETLNYDALQQQCTELKAQLDEAHGIGASLLAKFDAMELQCREADNLADQWAEKNERLMAERNTLRTRVERTVVRIDAFLGDEMDMPPHSLEALKSILAGGEA